MAIGQPIDGFDRHPPIGKRGRHHAFRPRHWRTPRTPRSAALPFQLMNKETAMTEETATTQFDTMPPPSVSSVSPFRVNIPQPDLFASELRAAFRSLR
jgi:hypothetical protein